MNPIVKVLMKRDNTTRQEAEELVKEAKQRVSEGESPEEILLDDFGLEPDYVFDLLV